MTPAVQDADQKAILRDVMQALIAYRDAESREQRLEKNIESAREVTARRRLDLGKELVRARALWPRSGPKAKGWGDFLAKLGLEQPRAWECMKLAGYVEQEISSHSEKGDETAVPTLVEAGIRRPQLSLVPDPRPDDDAPEVDISDVAPPPEVDRDTWCTPKWIADAIGRFDLDPCSNDRSHVRTKFAYDLERRGENGLDLAHEAPPHYRVFINPPYSDVMPWVQAYKHTRFCFLLKFDPSTKWCLELMQHVGLVLFPRGTRIEFEPPPGVKGDANQFPHALFYAREEDATAAIRKLCFAPWRLR